MAGLGLMNRRRAIASSSVLPEIDRFSYVRDSIVFELDGIDKGSEYDWEDLMGDTRFINHGAEELENGFRFDSSTSYLVSSEPFVSWRYAKDRTMEIVFSCENELSQTSILFATNGKYVEGFYGTFGYGIFPASKIMAVVMDNTGENNGVPTFAYTSILGSNYFATSNGMAVLNGSQLKSQSPNAVAGANLNDIYIGRRSSGNYFKGIIHAIRIHARALSIEELEHNRQIDIKRFKL